MTTFLRYIPFLVWLLLPAPGWADFQEGQEAFNQEDYATALTELRPLAEQGHVEAQYLLGVMYAVGQGTPKDLVEGARWFRLAAEQGHVIAQFELGLRLACKRIPPKGHSGSVWQRTKGMSMRSIFWVFCILWARASRGI